VDGNDVLAVHEAAARALAYVRADNGPYLLECKTFRMTGHSAHDPAHYVPPELFEEWRKLDPIERLEARMAAEGWAEKDELAALQAAIRKEVDDALEFAEASPFPDPASLTDGVYEVE
jgi:pyruvate dehydrogenase E1 component alpha subunit